MMLRKAIMAAGMAAAISLGTSAMAQTHGPEGSSGNPYYWWQMGPGMMGPGCGMGPGMMGPGMMGPGWGMGPGMMGPGWGMGTGMMGPGMMGPGMMGPGMMQPLRQDLSAADVKHMMEHRLAWNGNPNIKLGKVEEKDDDTIVAEIVTKDGSLVQKLEVDRHTGWMQIAE